MCNVVDFGMVIGDLVVIFGYMKVFDFISMVCEGEVVMVENICGVGVMICLFYNWICDGVWLIL